MKKANYFLFLISYSLVLVSITSCSVNKAHIDNELKSFYEAQKTEGCFTMLDNATGQITVYNMGMDTMRYAPGSTFDIINSLIALHTGTITNENDSITLKHGNDSAVAKVPNVNDGIEGGSTEFSGKFTEVEAQDLANILKSSRLDAVNMKNAFQNNDAEFTRYVVAKSGKELMRKWIDSLSYGNKIIGEATSNYWENNTLKISPDEQLGLLKRLYFDQLPFMKSVQESVRNMMVKEDNTMYKWSYKSAVISDEKGNDMNWTLGWVEENRHVYFFVNLTKSTGKNNEIEKTGVDISKAILTHYGFFKGVK